MEELRSTDALDREILDDARKKANRALKSAEQAAEATRLSWEKKLKDDLAALEAKHERRIASKRSEVFARLPLDQRRFRAERAERLLLASIETALATLPKATALDLLERELRSRAAKLQGSDLVVRATALPLPDAERLLSRVLPKGSYRFDGGTPSVAATADVAAAGPSEFPEIVIEGPKVTVRVGLAALGESLLRERRAELATALLGAEATDD